MATITEIETALRALFAGLDGFGEDRTGKATPAQPAAAAPFAVRVEEVSAAPQFLGPGAPEDVEALAELAIWASGTRARAEAAALADAARAAMFADPTLGGLLFDSRPEARQIDDAQGEVAVAAATLAWSIEFVRGA